ncbi:MAG: two-component system, OmpR family, sensor histidine kinase VicK [Gaiellaceae bacterium]|nr:two-component system, OmpR family, sensor histidine kinase VicK [Gaiellaceae bacterium]
MRSVGDWQEAALEALPVAVVVVDDDSRLVVVNARASELLSVAVGEEAPPFLRDLAARTAATGVAFEEVLEAPSSTGAAIAVKVRAAPMSGGAVCAIEDLTEQARRERADREFITNAAHQLRTPITAIATAIEVLQSGAKEAVGPRDRFLEHIERQTERLVRLIRAMLTLSRAERGDLGPVLGLVPLRPVLDGLLEDLPGKEGVAVHVDCSPTASAIADEALLAEALANLVGNAIENTAAGTVRVSAVEAGGDTLLVEIVDTGVGIDAPELGRVFERFHRGTSSGGGAGLGLPIARAAIEALGGTIALRSEVGAGTTVSIRLRSGNTS